MKQKSKSLQGCLHPYLRFLFLRIFSHNQDQKQSWPHMQGKILGDNFLILMAWLIHLGSSLPPLPLARTASKLASCLARPGKQLMLIMANNSLFVPSQSTGWCKKWPRKSCFFCIWLRAQNIQEHNDYPGYLHSTKEIRAVTRVSKWVLHVLSQDSSSSWESRVEEKRGGIVISLHHSQIIPLPEIVLLQNHVFRLVGVCTLGLLLEGRQEGEGPRKTTTCLTHHNRSIEICPHALRALQIPEKQESLTRYTQWTSSVNSLFHAASLVLCCCPTCSAYEAKPGQGLEGLGQIFHRAATSLCADSATFAIASTSAPWAAQSPEALPSLTRQERHASPVDPQGWIPGSDTGQEGRWFHPRSHGLEGAGHIPDSQLNWAAESARVDGKLLLTQSCNKSPPFWSNQEVAGVT